MPQKKEGTSVKTAAKHPASHKSKTHSAKKKSAASVTPKVAPDEYAFVTLDGKRLKSILELAHELDTMADHVFYHHVTFDRNDFANWVRDVFAEQALSEQIAKSQDKHNTHIIVLRHIVQQLPDQ